MKAKIELRRSRDFGEIVSDTLAFIGQNWKQLIKTYFVFCGFFVACNIIFSLLFQLKIINMHKNTLDFAQASRAALFGIEYFMLLFFGLLHIVSVIIATLCYITLYNEKGNEPPTLYEVWGYFKYYFLRVIGSSILLFLIFVAAVIVCMIPVGIMIFAAGPRIGAFIGFFCILIPILYFFTVLGLFFPIMIGENASFRYSFSKCFKLIKGRWWNTFGVFFVMAIIIYVGYLLIIVPFAILSGGTITFISYNVSFYIVILYSVIVGLLQVINIIPLTSAAVAYFSYAEDKESIGLMDRIETLGSTPDDLDPVNDEY